MGNLRVYTILKLVISKDKNSEGLSTLRGSRGYKAASERGTVINIGCFGETVK